MRQSPGYQMMVIMVLLGLALAGTVRPGSLAAQTPPPTPSPALAATATATATAAPRQTPTPAAPGQTPTLAVSPVPVAAPVQGVDIAIPLASFQQADGTPITSSAGLALPSGQARALYAAQPISAPLAFTDLALHWESPVTTTGALTVEVRVGPDAAHLGDWLLAPPDDISDPATPLTTTYSSLLPLSGAAAHTVQVRVTLARRADVPDPQVSAIMVHVIQGGTQTSPPPSTSPLPPLSDAPTRPPVVSRTAWGSPDGQGSPAWPSQYRRVHHLIVQQASSAQEPDYAARVRALWYYHAKVRGWGDIGYNYLVDGQGTIYEGRAGGDDVVGRHSYPFDVGSMGVGLLGRVPETPPTGLVQLVAWLAADHGLPPAGQAPATGVLACGDTVAYTRPIVAAASDYRGTGCGQAFNTGGGLIPNDPFLVTLRQGAVQAQPDYRALFLGHSTPATLTADSVITPSVTVRNGGLITWPIDDPAPVRLGYRWRDAGGAEVDVPNGGTRGLLPREVPYGDTVTLRASVHVPITPGSYSLVWDMIHEQKGWFAERTTSAPLAISVTVTLSDTAPPSRIVGLLPLINQARFVVDWATLDPAPPDTVYDVQFRVLPQGTWADWQAGVPTTEATFSGGDGYTYAFRSRAYQAGSAPGPWLASAPVRVTVDLRPPQMTVITPTDGLRVGAGPLLVHGSTEPGALLAINGQAVAVVGGLFTTTLTMAGADLPIYLAARDAAGNTTTRALVVQAETPAPERITDVPKTTPAYAAVEYMLNRGLLVADGAGRFNPDQPVSRAAAARLLAAAFNWPTPTAGTPRFGDVGAGNGARGAVEAAAANGVMAGYSDGNFYPNDPLSRAQAARALVSAAKWPLVRGPASPFSDVPLDDWAYPYVETAYRHGAISDPGAPFRPKAFVTRAELSLMLYYTLGDLGGK